jgi:hypothetical protein
MSTWGARALSSTMPESLPTLARDLVGPVLLGALLNVTMVIAVLSLAELCRS